MRVRTSAVADMPTPMEDTRRLFIDEADGHLKSIDADRVVVDFQAGGGGAHTHAESDVTGLTSDLSGKAADGHTHSGTYLQPD